MNANSLIGIIAVICFAFPIVVILAYRLYRHASLIALAVYYALTLLRCIGSPVLPPVHDFANPLDVVYNYVEIPLLLTSLLFFCPARQKQQKVHYFLLCFVAFEVMAGIVYGLTPLASLYIMVPGLLLVVLYALFLFLQQVKFTVVHRKNLGRVLMLGALLFSYSCYLLVFFSHFYLAKTDVTGIYTLYFGSSIIASGMMSAGLLMMRHRIRDLQELKVTRRELQMIFG